MPDLKFAELIDGVVHLPALISFEHGQCDSQLDLFLANFQGNRNQMRRPSKVQELATQIWGLHAN
jgi:hypothetical protein